MKRDAPPAPLTPSTASGGESNVGVTMAHPGHDPSQRFLQSMFASKTQAWNSWTLETQTKENWERDAVPAVIFHMFRGDCRVQRGAVASGVRGATWSRRRVGADTQPRGTWPRSADTPPHAQCPSSPATARVSGGEGCRVYSGSDLLEIWTW